MSEIRESDDDYTKAKKLVNKEVSNRIKQGKEGDEAKLTKKEINELADQNSLDLTDQEVNKLYAEQNDMLLNNLPENHFDKLQKDQPLTREEIEKIAEEKGLQLTEKQKQAMMNGDQNAVALLNLNSQEKEELARSRTNKDGQSPDRKVTRLMKKGEMEDEIEALKRKNNGKLSKQQLMKLMAKGDLTDEEMKKLAKDNGIKLNKKDLKSIKDEKKQNLELIAANEDVKELQRAQESPMIKKHMTKGEIKDALEEAAKAKGGKLSKAEVLHIMSKGNLSDQEMKAIAKKHGVKLTKKDLATIQKLKEKSAALELMKEEAADDAQNEIEELKAANGGKLEKKDLMEALKGRNLSQQQIEDIARKNGIDLNPGEVALIVAEDKKDAEKEAEGKIARKLTKGELEDQLDMLSKKQNGELSKAQVMQLLSKSDLTPEEQKAIAEKHGVHLDKAEIEALSKGKTKSKEMLVDEIEAMKQANGGELSKEDFLRLAKDADMSPEEMKQLAEQNGLVLTTQDVVALQKGKGKTKNMISQEMEALKKANGGKLSKANFMRLAAEGDLSQKQIKDLAKKHGIKLKKTDLAKLKPEQKITNDQIREILLNKGKREGLSYDEKVAFLKSENLGLNEDEIGEICDKNDIALTSNQIKTMACGQNLNLKNAQIDRILGLSTDKKTGRRKGGEEEGEMSVKSKKKKGKKKRKRGGKKSILGDHDDSDGMEDEQAMVFNNPTEDDEARLIQLNKQGGDINELNKYNKKLAKNIKKAFPNKKGAGMIKGFRKDKNFVSKVEREAQENEEALRLQDEAYGNAMYVKDQNDKTVRLVKRKKHKKKKRHKPVQQELVIVKTPYGEARFFKNSDGTRSKVKLKKKKPASPVGMEHRPVLFNNKDRAKEMQELDEETAKPQADNFFAPDGQTDDAFGALAGTEGEHADDESENHTVSTIVESDRINFDGQGEDDDDDFLEDKSELQELNQNREKDDITQFSRKQMKKMFGANPELASSKKRPKVGMNNTGGLSAQRKKKKGMSSVRSISSKRSDPVGLSVDEDYEPEHVDEDSMFNRVPMAD